MAYDTDNNLPVNGVSGEAMIATDYGLPGAHYQVMKLGFGPNDGSEPSRVTTAVGLPVDVKNSSFSVTGTVSLNSGQIVGVQNGVTLLGGTANFRRLTAAGTSLNDGLLLSSPGVSGGTFDVGTNGYDSIRVVGICGAFPVGVTALRFDIRRLSAVGTSASSASVALGGSLGDLSIDTVRVIGFSGAYPVETLLFGVTGISAALGGGGSTFNRNSRMPLRVDESGNLSFALASTSVIGATVQAGTNPYAAGGESGAGYTYGLQTRILRASVGATPLDTAGGLVTELDLRPSLEDTVRVIGYQNAYPVETLLIGLTTVSGGSGNKNTRVPVKVDDDGKSSRKCCCWNGECDCHSHWRYSRWSSHHYRSVFQYHRKRSCSVSYDVDWIDQLWNC